MASKLDVKFHCTKRARKSVKKSKHKVGDRCTDVMKVLGLHPEYGAAISGFGELRKMRVALPELKVGKSGGYRLVYRAQVIDEICYIVILEVYFKGNVSDLERSEYRQLLAESEAILASPSEFDWDDRPLIPPLPGG